MDPVTSAFPQPLDLPLLRYNQQQQQPPPFVSSIPTPLPPLTRRGGFCISFPFLTMSAGQSYPALHPTVKQETMAEVHPGIVGSDWYAPSSYAFTNDPYITPFPSSTVESQQWPAYARALIPDISMAANFAMQQPYHTVQQHIKDPSRPRSSPSTFGPGSDTIPWPPANGLGIYSTGATGQPTPVTSTFPPQVFQHFPTDDVYNTSSPPQIQQPQPRRPYTTIAPNPASSLPPKRRRDDDDDGNAAQDTPHVSSNKRKRTSSVASADLSEDDRFLVQLKEDENLPWKDIAGRFQSDKGKNFQVAALQMRYKRLREKFRTWEEQDVSALRLAHEHWEKYKWEIISSKMLEFGIQERWPARHCARKWQEMESAAAAAAAATTAAAMGFTPATARPAQFSSPVDSVPNFAFLPMQ